MMMAELMLSIVSEGLKLLNEHEARAIQTRVLKLREAWREELSKGSMRDDAILDMYDRELLDLSQLFLTSLKQASPKN